MRVSALRFFWIQRKVKSDVFKVNKIQECYAWCMFSDFTIVLCRCGLIIVLAIYTDWSMSQYLLKRSRKT